MMMQTLMYESFVVENDCKVRAKVPEKRKI